MVGFTYLFTLLNLMNFKGLAFSHEIKADKIINGPIFFYLFYNYPYEVSSPTKPVPIPVLSVYDGKKARVWSCKMK